MKQEDIEFFLYGDHAFRWEHAEPYMEKYGGMISFEAIGHRVKEWQEAEDGNEDYWDWHGRYHAKTGHRVVLKKGDVAILIHCLPVRNLTKWEGPCSLSVEEEKEPWYLGEEETVEVLRGPLDETLGDFLNRVVEKMGEVAEQEESARCR